MRIKRKEMGFSGEEKGLIIRSKGWGKLQN